MSILEISKTLIYESWYNYIKPRYQNNAKSGYMIQTALLFILKPKIFIKILQMILKNGLAHQTDIRIRIQQLRTCFEC